MVIFWFNPVFIFFKKAIQLNHEFLADEAVIESSCSISTYQQLLLQKATLKPVQLASNFNYSVTKKRSKMMKKQTSKTKKVVKVASLLPLAALLIMAFNDNVVSQGTSTAIELNINIVRKPKDFLEEIKQLGGDFNREGNQVFLTPPPPVLVPAKNN